MLWNPHPPPRKCVDFLGCTAPSPGFEQSPRELSEGFPDQKAKGAKRPQPQAHPLPARSIPVMRPTVSRALTVKLRGRPKAPDQAPRAHNVFSACGADTQAVHGPLQRLLGIVWPRLDLEIERLRRLVKVLYECRTEPALHVQIG